jgi:subtilase family serine protease
MTAAQIQGAYQAPAMFARGINGTGTVIAVIIPATAPGIPAGIAAYSRASGLPVPAVQVLTDGPAPADQAAWVQEGVRDLEMAHTLVRPGKSGGCHVCEPPLSLPVLSAS